MDADADGDEFDGGVVFIGSENRRESFLNKVKLTASQPRKMTEVIVDSLTDHGSTQFLVSAASSRVG